MKKKFLLGFLAMVMLLTVFNGLVYAEEVDEAEEVQAVETDLVEDASGEEESLELSDENVSDAVEASYYYEPYITSVSVGRYYITGYTDAYAEVRLYSSAGYFVGSALADKNGYFSISYPSDLYDYYYNLVDGYLTASNGYGSSKKYIYSSDVDWTYRNPKYYDWYDWRYKDLNYGYYDDYGYWHYYDWYLNDKYGYWKDGSWYWYDKYNNSDYGYWQDGKWYYYDWYYNDKYGYWKDGSWYWYDRYNNSDFGYWENGKWYYYDWYYNSDYGYWKDGVWYWYNWYNNDDYGYWRNNRWYWYDKYTYKVVGTEAYGGSDYVKGYGAGPYGEVIVRDYNNNYLGSDTASSDGSFYVKTTRALIPGETLKISTSYRNRLEDFTTITVSGSSKIYTPVSSYTSVFTIGSQSYTSVVNGEKLTKTMDVAPYTENGKTMLPLRYIADSLGYEVTFDMATNNAVFIKGSSVIVINLYSKDFTVDGKTYSLSALPKTVNGRIMLPVSEIAKALGLDSGNLGSGKAIEWDSLNKQVIITTKR